MVKAITVNLDVVEMMLYFWESMRDKSKISDSFIIEVAEKEDMKYLYNDNFQKESVRKVLSAITNKEKVNHPTKEESRFWSNNMWMIEDLDNMNNMVQPIKHLNLNYLKDELDSGFDKIEVIFVPGHLEEYYVDENKLIISFFGLMVDFMDETKVNIAGKSLKEYIEEKIKELK